MYSSIDFESSLGRTYEQLPPEIQTSVSNFTLLISGLPEERVRSISQNAKTIVEEKILEASSVIGEIAKLRHSNGIISPERYTVRTPRYVHTIDFAHEAPPESGNGPFWSYYYWTRYHGDNSYTLMGITSNALDESNLTWPYNWETLRDITPPSVPISEQRGILLPFLPRTQEQQQIQSV